MRLNTRCWMKPMTFLIATLCAIAIAAAPQPRPTPPPKAPPAPPVPHVTVLLNNNSQLSGELIEATPAGVTLKQNAKAEPKTTRWKDIKRVGNGMTHESILAEWRAQHADQLCETCKGEALAPCTVCGGTGIKEEGRHACDACNGTGSTGPCKTPHCVDGKIPCPNTCIKAEMFSGNPDKDGKRWKNFHGKTGNFQWSDAHIGDLIVYENGDPIDKGKCPKCDGTGKIDDPACKGTGKTLCATCHGHGVVGTKCDACVDGIADCPTCHGTGLKPADAAAAPAAPPADAPATDATPTTSPATP